MSTPKTLHPFRAMSPSFPNAVLPYQALSASEFNRQIECGIRRAPAERAKALRDIWSWFARA